MTDDRRPGHRSPPAVPVLAVAATASMLGAAGALLIAFPWWPELADWLVHEAVQIIGLPPLM